MSSRHDETLRAYHEFYRFSEQLITGSSLPELLDNLVDELIARTDSSQGFLFLLDGDEFHCRVARTADRQTIEDPLAEVSRSVLHKVVRSGRPLFINDVGGDPELSASSSIARLEISHVMCVPLVHDGEVNGLVYVSSDDLVGPFDTEDLKLLSVFALQANLILHEALRSEERRHRHEALVQMSPDAVVVACDDRCVFANRAAATLCGDADPQALVDRPLEALFSAALDPSNEACLDAIRRRQPLSGHECVLELDGERRTVEVSGAPVRYGGMPAMQLIIRDVTERKKLTARMMQMDRMIAVGTLAAGVAHEINNPLAYVSANLQFVRRQMGPVIEAMVQMRQALEAGGCEVPASPVDDTQLAELCSALDEAAEGASRVRSIVQDLKQFSRPRPGGGDSVDVRAVLESSLNMAANQIRHRARLVSDLRPVPEVEANESSLGQVFLNLLVNAAQAIDEEASVDDHEIRVTTRVDGEQVVVEIADTGEGIAEEHARRIFDPFFSTKLDRGGTGLGLSICQNIVESLDGRIDVESTPGQGTCFQVRLPIGAGARTTEDSSSSLGLGPHIAHLLIVDDEKPVARALQRMLAPDCQAIALTSPHTALDLLRTEDTGIDLVLCDLMMPDMSGMDLYERVCAHDPSWKHRFIFMTGGAFTERSEAFLANNRRPCLHKPFDRQAALEVIGRHLEWTEVDD